MNVYVNESRVYAYTKSGLRSFNGWRIQTGYKSINYEVHNCTYCGNNAIEYFDDTIHGYVCDSCQDTRLITVTNVDSDYFGQLINTSYAAYIPSRNIICHEDDNTVYGLEFIFAMYGVGVYEYRTECLVTPRISRFGTDTVYLTGTGFRSNMYTPMQT